MTEQIVSIDRIRAEALHAAQHDADPSTACRYAFGSVAARLWQAEFAKAKNRRALREKCGGITGIRPNAIVVDELGQVEGGAK